MYALHVTLGGPVVVCLQLNPRFAGSNPGDEDGFLRAIKILSKTSFGGDARPSPPCRRILRHVKDPYTYGKRYFVGKILWPYLVKFILLRY
jgi:hypothetical protein